MRTQCRVMEAHLSEYCEWLRKPLSNRETVDKRLTSQIKQYWSESGRGYRNIHRDLAKAKIACGRDRVLRTMRQAGLRAQRGYKPPTAYYSGKPHPAAPNTLE